MKPEQEPWIVFEHQPDPLERKLRMGCGSLLGLVFALVFSIYYWRSLEAFFVFAAVAVVGCAWLALRYGDSFFMAAFKWFKWL